MHTSTRCLQFISALFLAQLVAGNVEKTIFVAPPPSTVPAENAAIDDLGLDRLSPTDFTLRTTLNASFPTADEPYGSESWFYLEDLNPGQRYEVRVCWLATQPTSVSLSTYPLQEIVSDQSLLPAILKFSDIRLAASISSKLKGVSSLRTPKARLHDHHGNLFHPNNIKKREEQKNDPLATLVSPQADSILFLRIYAAADYFTTNSTLMNNVPPVEADIILDPFLFNVFPRSLGPTALYTAVVAVVAYFLGGFLTKFLTGIVTKALFGAGEESGSNATRVLGDSEKKNNVEKKKKK